MQNNSPQPTKPDFSNIVNNNPSGFILRTKLTEQTGGLLHGRTEANRDSLGIGIPGRITIGKRKVAYPVEAVVKYLQSKVTIPTKQKGIVMNTSIKTRPKRLDPIEKSRQNSTSFRFAITAKCYDCSGYSKADVRNCEFEDCPLYPHRTWKKKLDTRSK